MKDILRPILELLVVLPGLLLGYFPVKTYLKQSPGRLAAWLFPLMACLCIGSGLACYRLHASTVFALAGVALAAICLYTRTLTISLWKSGTIALSVCAVFACVNSLSRAVSAAIIRDLQLPPDGPWLCLGACVFYNAVCWVIVLAAYYPATHTVRAMVEDDNFAQTWYVFWVLPLAFILLNLFMIDPALSVNAPDRPRTAGLYCAEQCASGLYVLLQCGFPADGNQSQPQCEAAAGKPVSFDAAAAL